MWLTICWKRKDNEQMMTKYEEYLKSVESMKEPEVPKVKLDMRGALEYAKSKGLRVCDLSEEEKARFVTLPGQTQ